MTITRAGLIARQAFPDALDALRDAAAWLEAHGCQPVIELGSAQAAGVLDRWPCAPREALAARIDVLIVFGGDGTLLDAASRVAASAGVPILGVNLGHLGFLTEVSRTEMVAALEALLAGRTRTESRLMLAGRVERDGTVVGQQDALNDIVITRGALSRMITIEVAIDGQSIYHVKADGLIVSTATGSTAYNLSAGGPIMHPAVDAYVLNPIAPHTLTQRPLVLPASLTVTLRPIFEHQPMDIQATFDGQRGIALSAGDVVVIERAARTLQLVRATSRTHFDVLRDKLKWGD